MPACVGQSADAGRDWWQTHIVKPGTRKREIPVYHVHVRRMHLTAIVRSLDFDCEPAAHAYMERVCTHGNYRATIEGSEYT